MTNPNDKLTKTQLTEQVANITGLSKKQAGDLIDATLDIVVQTLQKGQAVALPGLGTLSVKETAARTGVKPGTTQKIEIPAGKKVAFKVSTALKSSINTH